MKTYTIILLSLVINSIAFAAKLEVSRSLASIQRVDHARELLGSRYKKSIVSTFEQHDGIEKNILATITDRLPKKFKYQAKRVTDAIFKEAKTHSMDPYFVMAVISGESSFNPLAVGPVGEIGMMQIRPSTGKWMAEKIKFKWKGDRTLRDPVANIKLGTAYLAWLREKFDNHGQLYLAAYNMGAKNVNKAVGKHIWPKDYPKHVMKRYLAFYKAI